MCGACGGRGRRLEGKSQAKTNATTGGSISSSNLVASWPVLLSAALQNKKQKKENTETQKICDDEGDVTSRANFCFVCVCVCALSTGTHPHQ